MFAPSAEQRAQKLRAAGMAAASAVNWGCTPEEILAEVQAKIDEALSLASPAPAQPSLAAVSTANEQRDFRDDLPTPAMDALAAQLAENLRGRMAA